MDLPPIFDRKMPSCVRNCRLKRVISDILSIYIVAIVYQVFFLFENI